MEDILRKVGLGRLVQTFLREKITPGIIGKLSLYEFESLGVKDRTEMMRLRVECSVHGTSHRHRPEKVNNKFEIPIDILETLLEADFSIMDMCNILSVSESTVYRQLRVHGLSREDYDQMDDGILDGMVREVILQFPHCGEVMLRQILRQKGTKVQRYRLRDSLHRIDEVGIRDRSQRRLTRRVYNVSGVNHLWHVDTNHKLIRWRFVIVGGIDGFSRYITFLQCTDNNKAETVFKCFLDGVNECGLPLRVRSGKGLENLQIAEYMIRKRHEDVNAMITGKSTHNQRIERLWRDVFEGVLAYYYKLFYFMEDQGILDAMNVFHIFTLKHVYLPHINDKLILWRNAWCSHRVRTVGSSPLRLFRAGTLNNPVALPSVQNPNEQVEPEEHLLEDPNEDGENLRPIIGAVEFQNIEQMQQILDVQCPINWSSANHGIDVYLKACSIIEQRHQEQH